MNIEITENIIRGSIIYQLKQTFGDSQPCRYKDGLQSNRVVIFQNVK